MAMQLLPSFQSFLASARASSPLMTQHSPVYRDESVYPAVYPSRMYALASLTAREYEYAMRSPSADSTASTSASSLTEESEASSGEEERLSMDRSAETRSNRSPSKAAAAAPHRYKKKYLKEKQRCEIVRRVRAGEKQAHLAKEFGVSRAAVCYLLKHQTEILSRSADGYPHSA